MSYYDTIAEDLQRAREILARGHDIPELPECICDGGEQGEGLVSIPHEPHCPLAAFTPEPVGVGAIYGGDTYAAYQLLESFVAEIETYGGYDRSVLLQAKPLAIRVQELEAEVARLRTLVDAVGEKVCETALRLERRVKE